MKKLLTPAGLATVLLSATAQANVNLPLERLFAEPALSGTAPRSLSFSPDGSRVTYLKGKDTDANRLDLWQYQIKTDKHSILVDSNQLFSGPELLSDEEKPDESGYAYLPVELSAITGRKMVKLCCFH